MSSADDEVVRVAGLIERLLVDGEFRARFRGDPAGVCVEVGLPGLAAELGGGGRAMVTMELRESRSSLAGVVMAMAAEGVAVEQLEHVLSHGLPGGLGKALRGVRVPRGVARLRAAASPAAVERRGLGKVGLSGGGLSRLRAAEAGGGGHVAGGHVAHVAHAAAAAPAAAAASGCSGGWGGCSGCARLVVRLRVGLRLWVGRRLVWRRRRRLVVGLRRRCLLVERLRLRRLAGRLVRLRLRRCRGLVGRCRWCMRGRRRVRVGRWRSRCVVWWVRVVRRRPALAAGAGSGSGGGVAWPDQAAAPAGAPAAVAPGAPAAVGAPAAAVDQAAAPAARGGSCGFGGGGGVGAVGWWGGWCGCAGVGAVGWRGGWARSVRRRGCWWWCAGGGCVGGVGCAGVLGECGCAGVVVGWWG